MYPLMGLLVMSRHSDILMSGIALLKDSNTLYFATFCGFNDFSILTIY